MRFSASWTIYILPLSTWLLKILVSDLSETRAIMGDNLGTFSERVISGLFFHFGVLGATSLERCNVGSRDGSSFFKLVTDLHLRVLIRSTFKHEYSLCKKGSSYPQVNIQSHSNVTLTYWNSVTTSPPPFQPVRDLWGPSGKARNRWGILSNQAGLYPGGRAAWN